jgi:DNA-binding IclR family transcriptional regulator
MSDVSERELAIMRAIASGRNGILSAQRISAQMGYRPANSGKLAVSATLRSLQRRGFVGRIPPEDQWDHADWFLLPPGKEAIE